MPQTDNWHLLNEPFDLINYKKLITGLASHEFYDETKIVSFSSDIIQSVENIGTFQGDRYHNVLVIRHNAGIGSRVRLATETFKLMAANNIDAALIAYHTPGKNLWRFSLVTISFEENKSGRLNKKFSNPRRYSYVLGSEAKTVTPYKFLIAKGQTSGFSDLVARFSVEVVNNEFYKEIAKLYDELVGTEEITAAIKYPETGEASHQFAVRLIGRIVFCWFLKEKHSDNSIPLIDSSILSHKAALNENYYHSTLAPLFFEVLNKPTSKRSERFQLGAFGKVPYLNGGLFAPQYDDHYKYDSVLGFSVPGLIGIPDAWLRKLFEILELYNFTVDENTSVDIDLSIDPEMLGRIFENLLARINPETGETVRKSTGSFYTPREIVEYMVDESLVGYLNDATSIDDKSLRALVSYDLNDDKDYPLSIEQKHKVVQALGSVKVLDPACGSGAFPIGVLQKIVFMLQQIDPDAHLWFENQIIDTAPEVRRLIEREFEHKNFDYIRKLGIIRESIFGVDIQPIATEIARLRCFLTLVVDERVIDEEDNRGVYPLPNLDFKFVTANTLLKLDITQNSGIAQTGLFEDQTGINELRRLRDDYFNSHSSEREILKLQFLQAQNRMLQNMIANHSHGFSDVTQKLSTWDPFSHKVTEWFDSEWMFGIASGFDIVIANPPYVRQESFKEYKEELQKLYPVVYDGRADLYTYFIKLGFDLLKERGILTYITSNKYLVRGYGKKLRKFLSEEIVMSQLINFGELPVFKASVDSAIIISKRDKTNETNDDILTFAQAKSTKDISNIRELLTDQGNTITTSLLGDDVWVLENPVKLQILETIKKNTSTLGDVSDIFGGIKTGLDAAFVIDDETRRKLISDDPKSEELIKPWFKGREIKKWSASCKQYIIYIPQNKINIDEYDAIKTHLLKFKTDLDKRATKQAWFELQQPQERFTKLFEGEKIIYSEIAKEMRAFKDNTKAYGTMKMFFIPYNPIILAILNSKLFDWYARMTFSSLGDPWNGGRLEFKSMYMSKLPLPPLTGSIQDEVTSLVEGMDLSLSADNGIETRLNKLVYELYGVNEEEVLSIEESTT